MNKNKKGISPLIATVLVIGFTIVLAAMVITWGTKLFKDTVEETEAESKFTLACTTGLDVEVIRKALAPDVFTVTLRNNNQQRAVDDFVAVLNFEQGGSEQGNIDGPVGNDGEPDNSLVFPVPKEYRITLNMEETSRTIVDLTDSGAAPTESDALESVNLFPQFTIEGTTRNCKNSIKVNV